jgi:hypothetical protein
LRFPIILFLILNLYIVFSWWCWWYGGSFGQRSLIESYALLALPFAAFIKFISEKKWYYNIIFYAIALFFVWLNIFQTYQYEHHSLHWDAMTKELYFKQFGKLDIISDFDKYLDHPNYEDAVKGISSSIDPNEIKNKNLKQKNYNGRIEKSKKIIHLIAANNKYVCADKTLNHFIVANSNNPWQWETFTLVQFENNECAILSYADSFFCAVINNQNLVIANKADVSTWESFTMIELGNDFVAFRAVNSKYLSIDEKSMQLFAKGDSIGRLEKFKLIVE